METLDQRGVPCPMNYVRTKLKLETLESGTEILILLDDGEAVESVPNSVISDGHQIISKEQKDGSWELRIQTK